MTWSGSLEELRAEIAEQFVDPRWCDIQDRARCYGLVVNHEAARNHIVSVKPDETVKLRLIELVHTRPAWTAQELADALGLHGTGAAVSVGCMLPTIPGLLKCSGARKGHKRVRAWWISIPAVMALLGTAEYVLLSPDSRLLAQTGLGAGRLAAVLKNAGWSMRRVWHREGEERRWYPPATTSCAQTSSVC